MTFKEIFDSALAQCTEFASSMDNAKFEFCEYVNELLEPIVKDNGFFDAVHCSSGYGRDYDLHITLIMNATPGTDYINTSLITFKLKLERGSKRYSYYDEGYDYKVKAYTNISIHNMSPEESAKTFDTMDIMDLFAHVSKTDDLFIKRQNDKLQYEMFTTATLTEYADLLDTLKTALTTYNTLNENVRKFLNDKIYEATDIRLRKF